MYSVTRSAYCGMTTYKGRNLDRSEARAIAARLISFARREGFQVATLQRGQEWEVLEPETSAMVPDECGIISLKHDAFECLECGFEHETRDDAAYCCSDAAQEEHAALMAEQESNYLRGLGIK